MSEYYVDLAYMLLGRHGLQGWSVKCDHSKSRAGLCNHTVKNISLSKHLLSSSAPEAAITNIILHEIAHAIVGHGHGHDDVWKQKAIEIGCDGNRCHNIAFAQPKYKLSCPCGKNCGKRYRIKRFWTNKVCKDCRQPIVIKNI